MSSDRIDRAVEGAALAPLTSDDRQRLARLARRAWLASNPQDASIAAFNSWRHQQTLMCVERRGLRECRSEDYAPLVAHFEAMLGHTRRAQNWTDRASTDRRRQALAKLRATLSHVHDVIENPAAYVSSIAKSRFKTTDVEHECSANQIWNLVFDLRRAAQRRRQHVEGVPF
jgi:glycine/D-amino acid oxidase-like deaminating enzyme